MPRVFVGIGSNLGDREANVAAAVARLGELPGTELVRLSSLIETEPVGGPAGQGRFLNGAAELETSFGPEELLDTLQQIETDLGRTRAERWGPRTLDLDILMYNNEVVDTPRLQVPHPRMTGREFVLAPLAEIAPDAVHPTTGRTVTELLADLRGRA